MKITLDNKKFEIAKADMMDKMCEKESYSKEEVRNMMNSMWDSCFDMIMQSHGYLMQRIDDVVHQSNMYIAEHNEHHLPDLEKNHKKAILDSAGILEDFDIAKEPLEKYPMGIYASLKDIKIEIK